MIVYFPTRTVDFYAKLVGKYTSLMDPMGTDLMKMVFFHISFMAKMNSHTKESCNNWGVLSLSSILQQITRLNSSLLTWFRFAETGNDELPGIRPDGFDMGFGWKM